MQERNQHFLRTAVSLPQTHPLQREGATASYDAEGAHLESGIPTIPHNRDDTRQQQWQEERQSPPPRVLGRRMMSRKNVAATRSTGDVYDDEFVEPGAQWMRGSNYDESKEADGADSVIVGDDAPRARTTAAGAPSTNDDEMEAACSSPFGDHGGEDWQKNTQGRKCRLRTTILVILVALLGLGVVLGITLGITLGGRDSQESSSLPPVEDERTTPAPAHVRWFVFDQIMPDEDIQSFGYKIDMSHNGTRIAVASPFNDQQTGRVDVYELQTASTATNATSGSQDSFFARIGRAIIGDAIGDNTGMGLSLSGDGTTLAVGYPGNENGFVRVYRFLENQWRPIGRTLTGPSVMSYFGQSVGLSMDGSRLVVGAHGFGLSSGGLEGMACIYNLTANEEPVWLLEKRLIGGTPGDEVGYSVDMDFSGNNVVIGAPGDDRRWRDGGKLCWLMRRNGEWEEFLSRGIYGDDTDYRLGTNALVSGDGSVVLASIPDADTSEMKAGIVEAFTFSGHTFQTASHGFPLKGEERNEGLGQDFDLTYNGILLVLSSRNRDGITGAVQLYGLRLGSWVLGWDSFPVFPLDVNSTWYGGGPSVAISSQLLLQVAIGYESVTFPNGKSRPLIQIMQLRQISP